MIDWFASGLMAQEDLKDLGFRDLVQQAANTGACPIPEKKEG